MISHVTSLVENPDELLQWADSVQCSSWSTPSYAPNRQQHWFGRGTTYKSKKTHRSTLFETEGAPEKVSNLVTDLYSTQNSVLVQRGDINSQWHIDMHYLNCVYHIVLGSLIIHECPPELNDGLSIQNAVSQNFTNGEVVKSEPRNMHCFVADPSSVVITIGRIL